MEKKIVAELKDKGFGFTIVLENVPMLKVRGEWTPYINYNNLARSVLACLVELDGRLTGNQIKFIRQHFELTLQTFASRFGLSHPGVLKWEKSGDKPTGMTWSTEKDIRLFVQKELEGSAKSFLALYSQLETVVPEKSGKVRVDVEKLAA
jgi:hypothetical protein